MAKKLIYSCSKGNFKAWITHLYVFYFLTSFICLVKVFLSVFDENDEPIDCDMTGNIKVDVKNTDLVNYNPVVKLKRLSSSDLAKFMSPKTVVKSTNTNDRTKDKTNTTDDAKSGVAKIQNIPKSKSNSNQKEDAYRYSTRLQSQRNVKTMASKRSNDVNTSVMTNAKKQKLSQKPDLPATVEREYSELIPTESTVATLVYKINEIAWGKIKGWPHWPCRITGVDGKKYEVVWLKDYRKSKLFHTQLYKFHANFTEFSKKSSTSVGLETAIKEALIIMASRQK